MAGKLWLLLLLSLSLTIQAQGSLIWLQKLINELSEYNNEVDVDAEQPGHGSDEVTEGSAGGDTGGGGGGPCDQYVWTGTEWAWKACTSDSVTDAEQSGDGSEGDTEGSASGDNGGGSGSGGGGGPCDQWVWTGSEWAWKDCNSQNEATTTIATTTTTAVPAQEGMIRLSDGDSLSGRVEVYHEGKWGTVCDDKFHKTEADVVCRSMGFAFSYYVRRNWPDSWKRKKIWLSHVKCDGDEASLLECTHNAWGQHNCYTSEAVGVVCAPAGTTLEEGIEGAVRLAGGSSPNEGRVEIFHEGLWGTICKDEYFKRDEAFTICTQLGLPTYDIEIFGGDKFGPGSGAINMEMVTCDTPQTELAQCGQRPEGWNYVGCSHHDDVGIKCGGDESTVEVRLVGGSSPAEGRLEVKYKDRWGTVCDDDFTDKGAKVVCRMLNQTGGLFVGKAKFGGAHYKFPINMDRVRCEGTEENIAQCPHAGFDSIGACSHVEDVGIICAETQGEPGSEGELRLVEGKIPRSGRLEIYHNNMWGTLCSHGFGAAAADVACRQLGYGPATALGQLEGFWRVWAEKVTCTGQETSFAQCSVPFSEKVYCAHSVDVYIACDEALPNVPTLAPPPMPDAQEGDVRLSSGYSSSMGRVEVYHDGTWGTVCNKKFNHVVAKVVCRQLGHSWGRPANFGAGTDGTSSIIENIYCHGNETKLVDCQVPPLGRYGCNHAYDAGVICEEKESGGTEGAVRLVDGYRAGSGRVEVFHDGEWGTVCSTGRKAFMHDEAEVVCRQLGFVTKYGSAFGEVNRLYGWGHNRIWMESIDCEGEEETLTDCKYKWAGGKFDKCPLRMVIGVECSYGWQDTED